MAASEYVPVLDAEQSVLIATLCCLSTGALLEEVTGVPAVVSGHRYEGGRHWITEEDGDRLRTAAMAAGEGFAERYRARALEAATALLAAARDLVGAGEGDLAEGVAAFAAAAERAGAFAMVTPVIAPGVEGLAGPAVSEARAEVRSCYRIARAILDDPAVLEVFRTTAPQIALRRVEESFPAIEGMIAQHVDAYGWVRTRSYRLAPLSPREVVDRLQGIVLRWDAAAVQELGGPPPEGDDPLAADSRRATGGAVLLQAECLSRPFFGRVAQALSCTVEQALFAAPGELSAALSGSHPFPIGSVARRFGEGFTVYRSGSELEVITGGPAAYRPETVILTGMTACRGRATGPVRILEDQGDLYRLQVGDILVTPASTTDWASGPTVFPTRGGGPEAVGRAAAVVTDEGGLLSHAAVVCRERGIPCVLATERATALLRDGMIVEVDATQPAGRVVVLEARAQPSPDATP
jgi:phosphohistidine swiveling domain-containing protein